MNQTSEKKLANAGKPPPDDNNDADVKPPWLPHQDRGYAWVVCAASFFSHVAQCGVLYSMGMFYIVFRENMQGGSSAISLVSSINAGTAFFTAPLAGILVTKLGWRLVGTIGALLTTVGLLIASQATHVAHLYFSYGVITGMGLAFQYNPCLSVLPVYFNKWIGLAMGIAVSGCGIGAIIFPLFIRYLEKQYGWRGALVVCAGTQLHSVVCAALYRPVPATAQGGIKICSQDEAKDEPPICEDEESKEYLMNKDLTENENKKVANGTSGIVCSGQEKNVGPYRALVFKLRPYASLFKCRAYTSFCFSQLFYMTCVSIVYTHFGAFALSLGFTDDHAALLFFSIGITSAPLRLLSGAITQIPGCTPVRVCTISILLLGILTCLMSFYTTLPLLLMYGAMFGALSAPYNTLSVNVIKDMVQPDMLSPALGFLLVFLAPGSLFGPPIAGFLYDTTSFYLSSFYLAAALMVVTGLLNIGSLRNRPGLQTSVTISELEDKT